MSTAYRKGLRGKETACHDAEPWCRRHHGRYSSGTEADMQIKAWLLMQRVKEKTQRINSQVSLPKEEEETEEGERRRGEGGRGGVRGGRREKKG